MEETNIKYGLDLKFTKLEVPEVGLWANTFQMAGHTEDQQLPKEQKAEPPKPHPHQPSQEQTTSTTEHTTTGTTKSIAYE